MHERSRRRSRAVAAPMIAALALSVSGCGSSDEAQGVCVDEQTDQRVEDRYCDDDRVGGFGWIFFAAGRRYPAVGQRVSSFPGGTTTVPKGHQAVRGGASVQGGSVAKSSGGFGKGGAGGSGRGGGIGG